jgi:hypothetical protein
MPSVDEMRYFVADMYPGPKWKKKVKDMPDGQVMAIYMREHDKTHPSHDKPKEKSDDPPPF